MRFRSFPAGSSHSVTFETGILVYLVSRGVVGGGAHSSPPPLVLPNSLSGGREWEFQSGGQEADTQGRVLRPRVCCSVVAVDLRMPFSGGTGQMSPQPQNKSRAPCPEAQLPLRRY